MVTTQLHRNLDIIVKFEFIPNEELRGDGDKEKFPEMA